MSGRSSVACLEILNPSEIVIQSYMASVVECERRSRNDDILE